MSNKAIDKDYLLRQLKNFDNNVLEEKYLSEVDTELSSTSENAVQNKVIYTALQDKASIVAVNNTKTYKLTLTNVSALPQSWSVWGDYLDLQVEDFELSNYNAQLNDWQCSITEGEIAGSTATVFIITGNISGSTDITIYLGKPEMLTIFDDNFGENPEIDLEP